MELKFVVFFLAFLVGVPAGIAALTAMPRLRPWAFGLLVFLTCQSADINFVSHEDYRGTSRGFEVSMVDLVALVLAGNLLLRRRAAPSPPMLAPALALYAVYTASSALSLVNAADLVFGGFELLKMLRMGFFLWIATRLLAEPGMTIVLLRSLSFVVLWIVGTMLKQKYLEGIWQAKGPFSHQNSAVMYLNLINITVYSYLLNYRFRRKSAIRLAWWSLVLVVGCAGTVLTYSRGGLIFLGAGLAFVTALSFTKSFDRRKFAVAALLALGGLGVLIRASDTIVERFVTAPEESMDVREQLAIAALNMANDKVLGVGLNNWGIKINPPYPYGAHILSAEDEKGGLVETVFLMVAAECGWHTLVIYGLLLGAFFLRALRAFLVSRDQYVRALALGIAGGLLATYCESAFEWVLKQSNNFYQLMIWFAFTAVLDASVRGVGARTVIAGAAGAPTDLARRVGSTKPGTSGAKKGVAA